MNRYCQETNCTFFKYNTTYININDDTLAENPEYFDGLTLSMWIKFYQDTNSTGYVFNAMDGGEGYSLYVNDGGQYDKELTFAISGGGYQSSVSYTIRQPELEDWIIDDGRPFYAWGWVHVTAVWRAGEHIRMYINGDIYNFVESPTDVDYCPSNDYYVGGGPSSQSFKGGVDEVRIYSGADSPLHIEAEYHKRTFPEQWQGTIRNVTIASNDYGMFCYDVQYKDIEDLHPRDTVEQSSDTTFKVGYEFDVKPYFYPDIGMIFQYLKIIDNNDTLYTLFDSGYVNIDKNYRLEAMFGDSVFVDNFKTDEGWIVTDNAASGTLMRYFDSSTVYEYQLAAKTMHYYLATGDKDEDLDGLTSIKSPDIQLPSSGIIELCFYYYLTHSEDATNDDYLQVIIEGETSSSSVLDIRGTSTKKNRDNTSWESRIVDISTFAGEIINIVIKAADNANDNTLEAGIDCVKIVKK